MAGFIAAALRERGFEPSFAYYQPYTLSPEMSVPFHKLAARCVAKEHTRVRDFSAAGIGAWLPEIEFAHYWPTKCWRELIDRHDVHLSVSGNCLAATPFAMRGIPFWSWVATDWAEDRKQRAAAFPWYRRILDRLVVSTGARRLERKILTSGGTITALSKHTKNMLDALVSEASSVEVMPMGIDTTTFNRGERPTPNELVIGFVGRLDDPRKNIDLLLGALIRCRQKNLKVTTTLVSDGGQDFLRRKVASYGLQEAVVIVDYVPNHDLPELLARMYLFVIPSHQEGLCIAALEAMSCGVPVIATRCGGPEEFVIDGRTGYLVDARPESVADSIEKLVTNRELRDALGERARNLVKERYSSSRVKEVFWSSFARRFGPVFPAANG